MTTSPQRDGESFYNVKSHRTRPGTQLFILVTGVFLPPAATAWFYANKSHMNSELKWKHLYMIIWALEASAQALPHNHRHWALMEKKFAASVTQHIPYWCHRSDRRYYCQAAAQLHIKPTGLLIIQIKSVMTDGNSTLLSSPAVFILNHYCMVIFSSWYSFHQLNPWGTRSDEHDPVCKNVLRPLYTNTWCLFRFCPHWSSPEPDTEIPKLSTYVLSSVHGPVVAYVLK